jgi:hypothetical protein
MSFYELHGLRRTENVEHFGEVNFERNAATEPEADALAYAVAEEYAKRWNADVALYRTPAANTSSVSSFNLWPGQVHLITTVPAPSPLLCPVCSDPLGPDHHCNLAHVPEDEIPF